jgi:CheY-like chemotaxis protein
MLRTMGYEQVGTANSGVAALALLSERPQDFDVIVCDINMPSMDGIEFLQIVNQGSFRGAVILLSGEGVRIIHTVQKLLGGTRLVILGALEKPARCAPLHALLDCWKPFDADAANPSARVFSDGDLHTAQGELQWLLQ